MGLLGGRSVSACGGTGTASTGQSGEPHRLHLERVREISPERLRGAQSVENSTFAYQTCAITNPPCKGEDSQLIEQFTTEG